MVAVGDTIRILEDETGAPRAFFKPGDVGVVQALGVKYPGDVRVKFPHDRELIWVYVDEYERVDSEELQNR